VSVGRGEPEGSTGKKGEEIAAAHLISAGYRILRMNFRFQRCEVDIIAEENDTLVFIEVKTRRSLKFGNPLLSITPSKKRNIIKVAGAFVERAGFPYAGVRFDVFTVIFTCQKVEVEHIKDAFRSG